MVLASRNSGTLRLSEDERGLRVEADLPEDVSYSRDLMSLMRSGVVDKMSFGFQVDRKGDKWSDDGMERTLTSVRLFEVSVVTGFPAYEATTAAVRSLSALSVRTGISVDDLSDTLEALAQIVNGALPQPEPEPVSLLGLKQKNMDLLAKKW
jgi:phage head maturation protease